VFQQQHDRYVGSVYDPSRDLSPNLPVHSCDSSSMGDVEPSNSSTSNCSTPSNTSSSCHPHHRPPPPCNNNCGGDTGALCRAPRSGPSGGTFSDCDAFQATQPLLHPKLETPHTNPGTPPTPPTSVEDGVVCAGCGLRISDRFYLLAVDRRWHASCLQCCQCRQPLDGENTCYAREGNIYCKKDYYR
ncbi:hypothetical protein C0J52_23961, partial [Blattella germanica]